MAKRVKTAYPGVFYRESKRIGGKGTEKIFYIVFKKAGKVCEEKAGRQYQDDMTPARAASIRAQRIEGKRQSRKEIRESLKIEPYTITRMWNEYLISHPGLKGIVTDHNRFENYLKPDFGNKEPKDIVQLDITRLRVTLMKTKKPGTVKNVLELLRRIINFAVRQNLCTKPTFKVELFKVNNERTEDLTPGQLNDLLKAIEEDDHPQAGKIMLMALYTGMRRGELFSLKWTDIDFDKGFITIRDPKSGRDQIIPLNDGARDVLLRHEKTSEYVFPGRGGNKRVDINKQVNRLKIKAGLPKDFRPLHGLRHVYASMLASSGQVDMHTLQRLLTHKSPLMTQRYAHLRDETLRNASNVAHDIVRQVMRSNKVITSHLKKNEIG